MPKPRTSVIWLIPREDLQNIIDQSNSIVEVLQKLGFDGYNGNHRTLTRRINMESFDLTKMKANFKISRKMRGKNSYKIEDIFTEDCKIYRKEIKRLLIQHNIIEYKCAHCKNTGVHNDKPLILQLEHINGVNNDNRLENLCFLCPNCHSQTPSFSGRNCKRAPKSKVYESEQNKADRIKKMRHFDVSKEELQELIMNHPMTFLGQKFGVSDNAIKKRCKRLGVDLSLRKYKKSERAMGIEPT